MSFIAFRVSAFDSDQRKGREGTEHLGAVLGWKKKKVLHLMEDFFLLDVDESGFFTFPLSLCVLYVKGS